MKGCMQTRQGQRTSPSNARVGRRNMLCRVNDCLRLGFTGNGRHEEWVGSSRYVAFGVLLLVLSGTDALAFVILSSPSVSSPRALKIAAELTATKMSRNRIRSRPGTWRSPTYILDDFCDWRHGSRRRTTMLHMCQLLGMNCATATEFAVTWLPDFCQRGGQTDIHADGWGLAYYHGNGGGLRQFHDVEAASTSPLAQFLSQQRSISTRNMLAHIRYATSGTVDLVNVHPFSREMWALNWCFCHNGHVPLFEDRPDAWLGPTPRQERFYVPVGNTDSERTFCAILNALRAQFTDTIPSLPVLYDHLHSLCQEIVSYDPAGTILNFLLTCGPHILWVYSWPGRRPGSQVWNGIHYSVIHADRRSRATAITRFADDDIRVHVVGASPSRRASSTWSTSSSSYCDSEQDTAICIVATKPLTDRLDDWVELKPGELIVMDNGLPHVSARDLFRVELLGHGLNNQGKVLKPPRLQEDMRRYHVQPEFFVGSGI